MRPPPPGFRQISLITAVCLVLPDILPSSGRKGSQARSPPCMQIQSLLDSNLFQLSLHTQKWNWYQILLPWCLGRLLNPTGQVEASYLWEEEHVKAEQHSDTLEMDGWKKGRAPASHLPHNYAPWGNKGNGNAKSNSTCGSAGNKHQPSARHPGHHPLPHQHQAGLHTHSSDDTSAALHRGAMCTCESPAKGGRGHTLSKQQCPTTRNLRTRGTPNPRQTHPHLLLHVSTSQQRPPRSERERPSPLHCCKPNKSFPMRT